MQPTKIEWVINPDGSPGYTWNPITGCLNGCEYCYARKLANTRLRETYLANNKLACDHLEMKKAFDRGDPFNDPFYPRFWNVRLRDGVNDLCSTKPKGVFVCDMSDLFGIGIPEDWTIKVLEVIKDSPQHRFYLLTKQPQYLLQYYQFPQNCYVGVTVTNQKMHNEAIVCLSAIFATVKFISYEPLLNEIIATSAYDLSDIDQVIIGQRTPALESTIPKIEWIEEIVKAADNAGCKVFLKDNLSALIPANSPLRYGPAGELRLRQEMP